MRRLVLISAAAAVVLLAVGCEKKKNPVPLEGAGKTGLRRAEAATAAQAGVTLRPYALSDRELLMFLPRSVRLGENAPPGVTPAFEEKKGRLLYGDIRTSGAGSIPFAVLFAPESEGDADPALWKLYIDRDLDRELADERPVEVPRKKIKEKIAGRDVEALGARFPAVRVALPGGGVHAYSVTAFAFGDVAAADVRSATGLKARVRVFGRETDVFIYDANVNGRFGDVVRSPHVPSDDVGIDFDGDGRVDRSEIVPLSKRIYRDGRALRIAVSGAGRLISVEELKVRLGGLLRLGSEKPEDLSVQVFSDEYGLLGPLPKDGIPEGRHRLIAYRIVRAGGEGRTWVLAGGWLPAYAPKVNVSASGPPAEVRFGPPLEVRAWFTFVEGNAVIRVAIRGSGREDVRVGSEDGASVFEAFRILDAGGSEVGRGKLGRSPFMPGLWWGGWEPKGGIEKGTKLALEVTPESGAFTEGFSGRVSFEFGRSTPVRLIVSGVTRGSQAESAGIRPGDLILRYDGRTIASATDMSRAVGDARGKPRVELVVARRGAEEAFSLRPGEIGIQVVLAMPEGGDE